MRRWRRASRRCGRATRSATSDHAIGSSARGAGYGLLADHGGHGIGRTMHEDPHVPNEGAPARACDCGRAGDRDRTDVDRRRHRRVRPRPRRVDVAHRDGRPRRAQRAHRRGHPRRCPHLDRLAAPRSRGWVYALPKSPVAVIMSPLLTAENPASVVPAVSDDRAVTRAVHPPRDCSLRAPARPGAPKDDLAERGVRRVAGVRDALDRGGAVGAGVAHRSIVEHIVWHVAPRQQSTVDWPQRGHSRSPRACR